MFQRPRGVTLNSVPQQFQMPTMLQNTQPQVPPTNNVLGPPQGEFSNLIARLLGITAPQAPPQTVGYMRNTAPNRIGGSR